jgi:hypothetical protein
MEYRQNPDRKQEASKLFLLYKLEHNHARIESVTPNLASVTSSRVILIRSIQGRYLRS